MTALPEAPAAPGRERVAADVPGDVAGRLRVWAALRRMPAARVVAELICQAVPTTEQLTAQMQNGASHDRQV